MNPKVGQLMTMIMPLDPAEVFEADLPDLEQLELGKAAQLAALFGKYGSTKADPFTSKLDDLNAFAINPEELAAAKADALSAMAESYGMDKAGPYLSSMESLQTAVPMDLSQEALTTATLSKVATVAESNIPISLDQLPTPESLTEQVQAQMQTKETTDVNGMEIALMDEIGQPLAGQPYEIMLPDGKMAAGMTDEMGKAKIAGFADGLCKLSLPTLDKGVW